MYVMLQAPNTALRRTFDSRAQERFALLSGDVNPIHMNEVAARRTQAGNRVVHGVHAALWALEQLAGRRQGLAFTRIHAQFRRFMLVGEVLHLCIGDPRNSVIRLEISSADSVACTIDVNSAQLAPVATRMLCDGYPTTRSTPLELGIEQLAGCCGLLEPAHDEVVEHEFPRLTRAIGREQVRGIVQLSAIVGMYCPGLHSIFDGFDVSLTAESHSSPLTYRVNTVDPRFSLVNIEVGGSGLAGHVTAFLRQPPAAQMEFSLVQELVRPDEFASVSAVIVGASRGLGAATAKILAAGGATVFATYAIGKREAEDLRDECGGRIQVLQCDVTQPLSELMSALDRVGDLTQMYYFATSHIGASRSGRFSQERFQRLYQLHVQGFYSAYSALSSRFPGIRAFYPSTAFLEERPRDMTEYCMVKSAAEILCADLNRFTKGTRISVARLPRTRTDQTASVVPEEMHDAVTVMLPYIREMSNGAL